MAPSCFEDSISILSIVATWLPTGLQGVSPNSRIGRNVVVASKSGLVKIGPIVLVGMALIFHGFGLHNLCLACQHGRHLEITMHHME